MSNPAQLSTFGDRYAGEIAKNLTLDRLVPCPLSTTRSFGSRAGMIAGADELG